MKPIKIPMIHTRDTKGTHFYEACKADAPIKSAYIKRDTFPDGKHPLNIVVTVESVDE